MEKLTVLFFDRHRGLVETWEEVIQKQLGCEVHTCSSVGEIVRINENLKKDFKFVDVAFLNLCSELKLGNWYVIDKLRADNPFVKIFAMSSDENHPMMKKPDPIFNGAIIKPFSLDVMEMILKQVASELTAPLQ